MRKINRRVAAALLGIVLTAGGVYFLVGGAGPRTAEPDEAADSLEDRIARQVVLDPRSPNLTADLLDNDPDKVSRFHLPKPDPGSAVSIEEGLDNLKGIEGVAQVLDAIAARDAAALLALFRMQDLSCVDFRTDVARCAELNGAVDGKYRAIAIEDGGYGWTLAEVRAAKLLETILSQAVPSPVLATRDRQTPEGEGGIYYIAFTGAPFDASDSAFNYASDTVGNGFGLKIEAGSALPILEFSLLSEEWNALKWTQNNGASNHLLLFPEETDGYAAMYDEMEEHFRDP